jgi:DNA polymerase III epsilon subunit-like protein
MQRFIHPTKSQFRGRPIDEWVDACWYSWRTRAKAISDVVQSGQFQATYPEFNGQMSESLKRAFMEFPQCGTFFQIIGQATNHHPMSVDDPVALVVDTETTGTSKSDTVIELAYVLVSLRTFEEVGSYEALLKTEIPINVFAFGVHGIRYQDLNCDAKTELIKFQAMCNQVNVIVAHNVSFDKRLLKQAFDHNGIHDHSCLDKNFCTMKAIKKLSKETRGATAKNEDVYHYFNGPPIPGKVHRALTDARMTAYNFGYGKLRNWW